jgi:hypothetical protein
MSTHNDFSRRFFADFIASRIKAWGKEGRGSGSSSRSTADGAGGPPGGASPQPGAEARPADPGPDVRRPMLPGRSDRRHASGLGMG